MDQSVKLVINTSSELYNLPPEQIAYLIADGNYSIVRLLSGDEFLLTFQLGKIENLIMEQLSYTDYFFVRVGKSLIVNMNYVLHINVQKQTLLMNTDGAERVVLTASREALKKLIHLILEKKKSAVVHSLSHRFDTVDYAVPSGASSRKGLLRGESHSSAGFTEDDVRILCGKNL